MPPSLNSSKLMLRLLLASLLLTSIASAIELPGTDGKTHDPLVAGDKKAVVLFFVSPF